MRKQIKKTSPAKPNVGSSHATCYPLLLLLLMSSQIFCGCAPRVIVRANPQPNDRGIRYYRPKPYLKVEPAEVATDKNQTKIVPGVVRISLAYLPDFSEEYSIDVRSGLGIANVGIKLEDGWNLTEISQQLDSQTDENTKAFASLLSAVGDVVPTASSPSATPDVSFSVPARNVPIGFYESIIGRDQRGCKRLYGFRYVGFVPFAGCPIDMGGQQSACCNDPSSGLYGLSFVDGQMLFLPLDQMAHLPATDLTPVNATRATPEDGTPTTGIPAAMPATPMPAIKSDALMRSGRQALERPLAAQQLTSLEVNLQAHLNQHFTGVGEVRATNNGDRLQVHITVPASVAPLPIQQDAHEWLQSNYGAAQAFDVIIAR